MPTNIKIKLTRIGVVVFRVQNNDIFKLLFLARKSFFHFEKALRLRTEAETSD